MHPERYALTGRPRSHQRVLLGPHPSPISRDRAYCMWLPQRCAQQANYFPGRIIVAVIIKHDFCMLAVLFDPKMVKSTHNSYFRKAYARSQAQHRTPTSHGLLL
jgi:hypothetical protein